MLVSYRNPENASRSVLYELDLSKDEVEIFVEQYLRGRVLFKGKWLDVANIDEVEILETRYPHDSWSNIVPLVSVRDITISSRGRKAKNVTRKFIRLEPNWFIRKHAKHLPPSKNVFIVHGKDHKPMKELRAMLSEFGLNPIILHEQPSGSRTIIEKLEKYSDVGYAFVILTPDDICIRHDKYHIMLNYISKSMVRGNETDRGAKLASEVWNRSTVKTGIEMASKKRARQNVILEFGYFMGLLGRDRVCCLYKGNVELPSDMYGIVYLPFKESVEECRDKIIKELKVAGYEIKI
ncbi:MAG: nucleotide-binding protein [Candidatus Bathyarchaeia archaeon]